MPKSRKRKSKSRSRHGSRLRGKVVPKHISRGLAKRYVYKGLYEKTRGGLRKSDLTKNSEGRIVSKKQQKIGERLQRRFPYDRPGLINKWERNINH